MIRYTMACPEGHEFEAWFGSAAAYDEQAETRAIVCPACGSLEVKKAPMAPYVKRGSKAPAPPPAERPKTYAMMRKLRAELTANSDYVGPKFPEEARKIYYDEAPSRAIHGEATVAEARELDEEGVPVFPLPPLPGDQN